MPKVVYIVGAGASTEFGNMPVGGALAQSIQSLATNTIDSYKGEGGQTAIIDALSFQGFSSSHMAALIRVRDAVLTKDSIDDFVNEWQDLPTLPQVAKYCIAHEILYGESQTGLGAINGNNASVARQMSALRGSWLDWIVRYTNRHLPRRQLTAALQDTAFITFNYDRCIEYYLYLYLRHSLDLPEADARDSVRQMAVEHVYGAVGEIKELGGQVAFGHSASHALPTAADRVRTYCESVESNQLERIHGLLSQADRLVFLGCAFHDQNLQLLFPHGAPSQDVWATTYRMRPRRTAEIKDYFEPFCGRLVMGDSQAGPFLDTHQDELF